MCFGKQTNKITELPKTYKAVSLVEYGKPMVVTDLEMPVLVDEGDVLIKVESAGVSVIDFYNISGLVPTKLPITPGDEGSGIVVQGKGKQAEQLIGKKVSFIRKLTQNTGTYGQYCISTVQFVMEVPMSVAFDQAAVGMINPLTAAGLFKKAQKHGAKAVISTAAGGQIGQQIERYYTNQGVPVINIVRRQEQLEQLKKNGVRYVLNSTSENFEKDLELLADKLQANVAIDSVYGKGTETILNAMPQNSTLIVYDCLSQEQEIKVSLNNLLIKKKSITHYSLYYEYYQLQPQEQQELLTSISSKLTTDFKSKLGKTFTYDQINEVFGYYFQNMSKGKNIVIQVKPDGIDIHRDTPQIYELCQSVEYFSEFSKQKLHDANSILETCLAFTTQKFGINTNKKQYKGSEYDGFEKIVFDNDAVNFLKKDTKKVILTKLSSSILDSFNKVKALQVIYFDLSGEWNDDPNLPYYISQLLKQFKNSLKYVWLNLNGWKNMSNKSIKDLCSGIQELKVVETLIVNILQWGKNNTFLTSEVFTEFSNALSGKETLESLSFWVGYIKKIEDQHIELLLNTVGLLKNIKTIDFQFPYIGSETDLITNDSLQKIFKLPQFCFNLEEFSLGLDRWGYKNEKITIGPFKTLLQSLNLNPNIKKFTLSMKEAYNLDTSDKKEVQRMIKGVVEESEIKFFTDY